MKFNEKKEKVFEYLVKHAQDSPSVREICAAVGLGSTSTAFRVIHALEEEGKVFLFTVPPEAAIGTYTTKVGALEALYERGRSEAAEATGHLRLFLEMA